VPLLDVAAASCWPPPGDLFAHQEDDQLANTIALTLTGTELPPAQSVD
jgi:hypothetical protein